MSAMITAQTQLAQLEADITLYQIALAVIVFSASVMVGIVYRFFKHRQQQQKAYRKALQAHQSQWLHYIRHEIKTPLATLKLQLDTLCLPQIQSPEKTQQLMQHKITHLQQLITDIDELMNMKHFPNPIQYVKITLDDFLGHIHNEIASLIAEAGHKLVWQNQLNKGYFNKEHLNKFYASKTRIKKKNAHLDPQKMRLVILHVINNAMRFSPVPSTITCKWHIENQQFLIEIADNGPGVPKAQLPLLFENLYRVETSRNPNSGGFGLGLSLCKAIVVQHQGSIYAQPSESGGLCVTIRIPLHAR